MRLDFNIEMTVLNELKPVYSEYQHLDIHNINNVIFYLVKTEPILLLSVQIIVLKNTKKRCCWKWSLIWKTQFEQHPKKSTLLKIVMFCGTKYRTSSTSKKINLAASRLWKKPYLRIKPIFACIHKSVYQWFILEIEFLFEQLSKKQPSFDMRAKTIDLRMEIDLYDDEVYWRKLSR
jgi:hypothetical protein